MVYNFTFNKDNPYWCSSRKYNLFLLHSMINRFNDKLRIYGFVSLFEVLCDLGIYDKNIDRNIGWSTEIDEFIHIDMNRSNRGSSNIKVSLDPCSMLKNGLYVKEV